MRKLWRSLIGLFALLGVISSVLLGHATYVQWRPAPPSSIRETARGQFKLVHLIYVDGGPLGGTTCVDKVAILPIAADTASATNPRYWVFVADCDTFADHSSSPALEWLSDDLLRITASINATAQATKPLNVRKSDASGKVRIQFEAHE
jgi:hypothetical protein